MLYNIFFSLHFATCIVSNIFRTQFFLCIQHSKIFLIVQHLIPKVWVNFWVSSARRFPPHANNCIEDNVFLNMPLGFIDFLYRLLMFIFQTSSMKSVVISFLDWNWKNYLIFGNIQQFQGIFYDISRVHSFICNNCIICILLVPVAVLSKLYCRIIATHVTGQFPSDQCSQWTLSLFHAHC